MTSPTSAETRSKARSKKRSLMPSSKLRRSLRAHGHALSALVHVGKGGLSPAVIKQVEQTLADHELVKLKVDTDSPDDRLAVAEQLAARPGVNVVQIVGHAVLVYKRHPQKPRFEGGPPKVRAAERPAERPGKRPDKSSDRRTGKRAARR
ncbi:MAG TPA: YhbY family RNA-binding protein [Polyangia bacterium]|jgi:RNA-binding protein|nr:YhbY family RNA-binding protein [Polyangia bacterium]